MQTPLANEEVKHPFISIAPELSLASDQHLKLRDHILNENQTNFIYKNHINNSASINEQINKNIDLIKSDNDVQSLFNSRRHSKAFVIGTGPSLERCYTYIKSACKNENILIIAVDTAFKALTANSIKPDIVVTVDEETNTNELSPQHSEGISLVYFPRTNINVLSAWRGKRYTSYSTSPAYNRISETHPKGRLYSGGSVIHPAVDLAVKMGANSITLFGCDFGFHSNKTHAEWKEGELGLDYTNNQGQVKNGYGEMIATVPNFRSYLCNLENYIKLHPHITFYNSCRYGALIAGTEYIEAKL
ncbi:DUF115 domain-containing protein [Dasania sp. GY-19]|uniref:DUF115 domain-containing protein n=1 Tax=Dasania phycosphaerae TaxID=2950436 RepID=A0A9J6RHS1_9GAMM|nr:DUF115 domain-containing protein [Dasania phycosphaerae]